MKKRAKEDAEVPISSLIDVIFLLIMFFVVTADMANEAESLDIKLVESVNMPPVMKLPPKRVTINVIRKNPKISNTNDPKYDEGSIYLGGDQMLTLNTLKQKLIQLKEQMGMGTVVILRTDRDVRYKFTADAVEMIKASGLRWVKISAVAISEAD